MQPSLNGHARMQRHSAEAETPPPTAAAIELVQAGPDDLDLMCDLVDCSLRGDAFIPRGQMKGILGRGTSTVWLILLDDVLAGFAILYSGGILHNLHLQGWARTQGIGSKVVALLQPKIIRSKTNMKAGDPTPFYERQGYVTTSVDAKRPHINVMEVASAEPPPFAAAQSDKRDVMFKMMKQFFMNEQPAAVVLKNAAAEPPQTVETEKNKVILSKTEYEKMKREVDAFALRKAKQAAYQKRRLAEKVNSRQESMQTNV